MRPVPGLTVAEQPEAVLLPMVLWGEARGESNFTKLCILWVIKNRTARRHSTMMEEILRPKQFSSFNHDDPNLAKLLIGYKIEPGRGQRVKPCVMCSHSRPIRPVGRPTTMSSKDPGPWRRCGGVGIAAGPSA